MGRWAAARLLDSVSPRGHSVIADLEAALWMSQDEAEGHSMTRLLPEAPGALARESLHDFTLAGGSF